MDTFLQSVHYQEPHNFPRAKVLSPSSGNFNQTEDAFAEINTCNISPENNNDDNTISFL